MVQEIICASTFSTSKQKEVKFTWTEVEQKAFNYIKRIVRRKTLLAYPNFSKPFMKLARLSLAQLFHMFEYPGLGCWQAPHAQIFSGLGDLPQVSKA